MKNYLQNFFPITMGAGTVDVIDTQQEGDKNENDDFFGSQLSYNSCFFLLCFRQE